VNEPKILLIGGGVRSGKSSFAVERGLSLGVRRAFIATATRSDNEMNERIDRHQADRMHAFDTVEEPLALADTLDALAGHDVVVVDCLTHWLSNLLLRKTSSDDILSQVDNVVAILQRRRFHYQRGRYECTSPYAARACLCRDLRLGTPAARSRRRRNLPSRARYDRAHQTWLRPECH
jgi:hypothetical protein